MRSRSLKPGFFTCPELLELHFEVRVLFAGLWCCADREGRLEDRPEKIKLQVLPADKVDVDGLLDQLCEKKLIKRYNYQGSAYIQIINFSKHQNPHVREAQSTIPAPDMSGASMVQAPCEHGDNPADSLLLTPDSLNPVCSPKWISDDTQRIFDHWLTKENLIQHRQLDETQAGHVNAKLKIFSADEICDSIDNYSEMLDDDNYMMNYKWKIGEFMLRGCEKFMSENNPFDSYPKYDQEREGGEDSEAIREKIRRSQEDARRRNLGDGGDSENPPY